MRRCWAPRPMPRGSWTSSWSVESGARRGIARAHVLPRHPAILGRPRPCRGRGDRSHGARGDTDTPTCSPSRSSSGGRCPTKRSQCSWTPSPRHGHREKSRVGHAAGAGRTTASRRTPRPSSTVLSSSRSSTPPWSTLRRAPTRRRPSMGDPLMDVRSSVGIGAGVPELRRPRPRGAGRRPTTAPTTTAWCASRNAMTLRTSSASASRSRRVARLSRVSYPGAADAHSAVAPCDEHTSVIAAGVDHVWPAVLETLDRTFSRPVVSATPGSSDAPRRPRQGRDPCGGCDDPRVSRWLRRPGAEAGARGQAPLLVLRPDLPPRPLGSGSSARAESGRAFRDGGARHRLLVIGTGTPSVRRLLAEIPPIRAAGGRSVKPARPRPPGAERPS